MQRFTDARAGAQPDSGTATRRVFLKHALAGVAALALPPALIGSARAAVESAVESPDASAASPTELAIVRRTIEVNGRAAGVYGIEQPNGTRGLRLRAGDGFDVVLRNQTAEATSVHWHGLTPPWPSDGVPDAPLPPIAPAAQRAFAFALNDAGTYWMHAHTLREQQLLAAPLIVADADSATRDEQEVVILLHDFSFTSPEELLARLTRNAPSSSGHAGAHDAHEGHTMNHDAMAMGDHDMPGMDMSGGMDMSNHASKPHAMAAMPMDLNDIDYDAYLANDRTLDDPEIVRVERGGRVRVRIINGASATAFTIDFGGLDATLIAVDGQPVQPVAGRRFPLSMAQRIDVRLRVPHESRAFPILALREGGIERTGIVLQTPGSQVTKLPVAGNARGPVLDLALEARLRALAPLAPRRPDKRFEMALTGDMATYRWGFGMRAPIEVDKGNRVEVAMRNVSMMAHPMHLHGHHFQVVAVDGRRVAGAMRDTVLVPPGRSVTIAVDANNPGQWAFHCHHLYHMETGMMTTFAYRV